jgi:succinate dehydrogenase/fumarate reductase flavoprotein subunit
MRQYQYLIIGGGLAGEGAGRGVRELDPLSTVGIVCYSQPERGQTKASLKTAVTFKGGP